MTALHFVFDAPPNPEGARFIECETPDGKSVSVGDWRERADGLWELVVETLPAEDLDPGELPTGAYLIDLAERLMRVPVMCGTSGADVDRLSRLGEKITNA